MATFKSVLEVTSITSNICSLLEMFKDLCCVEQ